MADLIIHKDNPMMLGYIKALSNPTRLEILRISGNSAVSVKNLQNILKLSASGISQNVTLLQSMGLLVETSVRGDNRKYVKTAYDRIIIDLLSDSD